MRAKQWKCVMFVTVLVRFVVMTALNMWVLLTVLYYQKQGSRSKKDDWNWPGGAASRPARRLFQTCFTSPLCSQETRVVFVRKHKLRVAVVGSLFSKINFPTKCTVCEKMFLPQCHFHTLGINIPVTKMCKKCLLSVFFYTVCGKEL